MAILQRIDPIPSLENEELLEEEEER